MAKNIQISPRMMRLLVLLEKGPKYGRQFALIAPDMFFCNDELDREGKIGNRSANVANIYSLLKRAETAGLIEVLTDFVPPDVPENEENIHTRRKYYGLTVKGQERLSNMRAMVNGEENV